MSDWQSMVDTELEAKIAKLPKWAQLHIYQQAQEIEKLKRSMGAASDWDSTWGFTGDYDPPDGDTIGSIVGRRALLMNRAHWQFGPNRIVIEGRFEQDRRMLHVRQDGRDMCSLVARPHSSNVLTLHIEPLTDRPEDPDAKKPRRLGDS